MPVTSTSNVVQFSSGQTSPISLGIELLQAADAVCYYQSAAGVTPVLMTLTTDYTIASASVVTGATLSLVSSGVAGSTTLPAGAILTVCRDPSEVQLSYFPTQGPMPGPVVQGALDLLTMEVQAARTVGSLSIQAPRSDALAGLNYTLPPAAQRANKVAGFDGSGNVVAVYGVVTVGVAGTFVIEDPTDPTKQMGFLLSGMTTGKTLTLAGLQTTSQTLQFPNITATDTVATLKLAQTFSGVNTFSAAITSTVATGTAPFIVASTTQVANLNAASLGGATFASPGTIGGTAPGAATFKTPFQIVDATDPTKIAAWSLSGMTTGTTLTLAGTQTTSQTLNVPNITTTDTLATLGLGNAFTGANTFSLTTTSITGVQATQTFLNYAPIATSSGSYYAGQFTAQANVASQGGALIGLLGAAALQASATGTYATVWGGDFQASNLSAGTVTGLTGLHIESGVNSGGGTVSTNTGLQIGNQSVGATNYAIHTGTGTVLLGDIFISTPPAISSGIAQVAVTFNAAASTAMPSGVENSDFVCNFNPTLTFATTVPTTQRSVIFKARTYDCSAGSQTIATAATVSINAAPAGTANVSITNAYALWVQGGTTQLQALKCVALSPTGAFTHTGTTFGVLSASPVAQVTGYGTPTGGAHQGTFAAGSITLANLAAAVAQMILDIKSFGFFGA